MKVVLLSGFLVRSLCLLIKVLELNVFLLSLVMVIEAIIGNFRISPIFLLMNVD